MAVKRVFVRSTLCFFLGGLVWASPCASSGETFRDALGREVSLAAPPQRLIALAPSVTEILYFLGLGDRVVGVTEFSTYPPEAARKPRVGSFTHLNVERIIDLKPDLVLTTVDGNRPALVELLEQARIKTYVIDPRNVLQVIGCVREVGKLCAMVERAEALAGGLQARLDRVVGKTRSRKGPTVLFQINVRPIMTVNRETLQHDLIHLAGGVNLFAEETLTYPRISVEEAIRRGPDVIIISSMERGGRFEEARLEWMRWKAIPAVRGGRVHLIDSDITDRPAPRVLAGLEEMARMLHPEERWE